jgi:hypothetical protein
MKKLSICFSLAALFLLSGLEMKAQDKLTFSDLIVYDHDKKNICIEPMGMEFRIVDVDGGTLRVELSRYPGTKYGYLFSFNKNPNTENGTLLDYGDEISLGCVTRTGNGYVSYSYLTFFEPNDKPMSIISIDQMGSEDGKYKKLRYGPCITKDQYDRIHSYLMDLVNRGLLRYQQEKK